jgi:hypothetical protein
MPSTLNAILEDKRMNDILAATSTKADGIPFLLLPLRLETRFMQVDKPTGPVTYAGIDDLLQEFLFAQVQLLNITTAQEVPAAVRASMKSLRIILNSVIALTSITAKEKEMLAQMNHSVASNCSWFEQLYGTAPLLPVRTITGEITTAIAAIPVNTIFLPGDIRIFINDLQKVSAILTQLSDPRKIPYTNKKNKKDLYNWLQTSMETMKAFYTRSAEQLKPVTQIQKNQLQEINTTHTRIRATLANILPILQQTHPDATWQQFVQQQVQPAIAEIDSSSNKFATEALPALQQLPVPVEKNATVLLYQTIRTFLSAKEFAVKPPEKFQDLKRFKVQFADRINTINQTIDQLPESSTKQRERLKSVFQLVAGELEQTKTKVMEFPHKNKSQLFGKTALSEFITGSAAEAITKGSNIPDFPAEEAVKQHELWLRIYPDDIYVHTHEEALTPTEQSAGKRFWNTWWIAGTDEELQQAAWRKLCGPFGTKRASWIARSLDPRTVNSTNNNTALGLKPYEPFKAAIATAATVNRQLAAVTLPTYPQLTASLNQVKTTVTDHIAVPEFLLKKMEAELLKTEAALNALLLKSEALTPAERLPLATLIDTIKTDAENLNGTLRQLKETKALSMDEAAEQQPTKPEFPEVKTKETSWSVAPTAKGLPERFVAITFSNSRFQQIIVGNPVPESLQLGPNPALFSNKDEDDNQIYYLDEKGNLHIEEGMRWMTDYQEAVKKGMGITIPITEAQFNEGFDKILVLGIKEADAANTATLLESIFNSHTYAPDGMSILKPGTPTNNTENDAAGYSHSDRDEEERFDIEIRKKQFNAEETDPFKMTDAQRLSFLLGISPDILQKVNNRMFTHTSNALAMNTALWPATLGHTMEEMWDEIFTYDNINRAEKFFTENCSARGPLPAIRIGSQPYGILPTTAYSKFVTHAGFSAYHLPQITATDLLPGPLNQKVLDEKLQKRFDLRLFELLNKLNETWTSLRKEKVKHYAMLADGDPQKDFLEMLGLHATSLEYFYRYGVNITRKGVYTGGASNFDIRNTHGSEYARELFKELMIHGRFTPSFLFLDEQEPSVIEKFKLEDAKYSRIRDQFEQSRIFRNRFIKPEKELQQLTGELIGVQPGNYIDWLLNSFMDDILAGNNPANFPSRSVLFLLLRQSIMQGYQKAALEILQTEHLIGESFRKKIGDEDTYSDWNQFQRKRRYNTKWHLLLKDLDDLQGGRFLEFNSGNPFYQYLTTATGAPAGRSSMAVYINKYNINPIFSGYPNHGQHIPFLQKTDALRNAFRALQKIPAAELELLLSEHVDITSYRLDSWFTAFATRRLKESKQIPAKGIYLGAYGWLENLRKDSNTEKINTDTLPEELRTTDGQPVYHDPDNEGYIHAPSINHGITAAILRSAFKVNYAEENINNRLAVNLSSARVRMGMNIIDGVRNGLPVGAVLGFQFERGLHERYLAAELDKFILPFRNAFPLVVPPKDNGQPGKEPAYNTNVVDGLALLDKIFEAVKWMDFPAEKNIYDLLTDPTLSGPLAWLKKIITDNGGGNTEYDQVAKELNRLADSFDALGDIAVSESVYQIVNGNHVRAAAMVSSLAQGKNIPDPQIIDTPRTGLLVTQRVLYNLEPRKNFQVVPGWTTTPGPRAEMEPTLNNWLGTVLGDPASTRYLIQHREKANSPVSTNEFTLAELGLQPLDLLFLSASETDLKNYAAYQFRRNNPGLAATTLVEVDFRSRLNSWPADERSFYENDHTLKQLRELLIQAKFAGADQYLPASTEPDSDNPSGVDIVQLENRISAALKAFSKLVNDVKTDAGLKIYLEHSKAFDPAADAISEAQLNALVTFLLGTQQFGVPNSLPAALYENADNTREIAARILVQSILICDRCMTQISNVNTLQQKITAGATTKQKLPVYLEQAKELFGKNFVTIPIFNAVNGADLSTQLNLPSTTSLLRNNGAMAMQEWLETVARVRSKMKALHLLGMNLEITAGESFSLSPVQLPYRTDDYWIGLPYPETHLPGGDKLSIVIIDPGNWISNTSTERAGFVVDEWMEIIPNAVETTGIAFNYNQPNAMAPQSLLLAVTPEITGHWKWENLVFTLMDTLEMAKNRAVEPDHLDQSALSHILPGIMAEVAPPQSAGMGDTNPLGVQVVMDFAFNQVPPVINP